MTHSCASEVLRSSSTWRKLPVLGSFLSCHAARVTYIKTYLLFSTAYPDLLTFIIIFMHCFGQISTVHCRQHYFCSTALVQHLIRIRNNTRTHTTSGSLVHRPIKTLPNCTKLHHHHHQHHFTVIILLPGELFNV